MKLFFATSFLLFSITSIASDLHLSFNLACMARKHCLPQNLTEYDQAFIGQLNYVGGKKAIDQYCEKSTFHLLRTSPQFRSDRFNTINFKLPKDLTCLRPIMGEIENHYN